MAITVKKTKNDLLKLNINLNTMCSDDCVLKESFTLSTHFANTRSNTVMNYDLLCYSRFKRFAK